MCLYKVIGSQKLPTDETVFKVVNVSYDGKLITTAIKGAVVRMGYNKDENQSRLTVLTRQASPKRFYNSGYHCYTKKKDCDNWAGNAIAICRIPIGTKVIKGTEDIGWNQKVEVIVTPILIVEKIQMRSEDAE
jgi:hypothetical protein